MGLRPYSRRSGRKDLNEPHAAAYGNFSGLSASANAEWILYAQQDQSASGIVLADFEK
jgi:hypothetical protein